MLWILPACSGWLLLSPQEHWCFSITESYTSPAGHGHSSELLPQLSGTPNTDQNPPQAWEPQTCEILPQTYEILPKPPGTLSHRPAFPELSQECSQGQVGKPCLEIHPR